MTLRTDRISELIKREVATIIQRLDDRRIGFVSILHAKVSPDLRHAVIYYSQIGDDTAKKSTRKALKSASGFIKGEVGNIMRMKTVPDLQFVFDDSIEKAAELITKINRLSDDSK